jgi:5-methylcytosine-specific restriction endonuclease McrA
MGLKKKGKKKEKARKRIGSGSCKKKIALSIVATDATFNLEYCGGDLCTWVGRCIHCASQVVVHADGRLDANASIEHIQPICAGGAMQDPENLAIACVRCNNQKGIHHDRDVGRGGRADEVVAALKEKRMKRWRGAWSPYNSIDSRRDHSTR